MRIVRKLPPYPTTLRQDRAPDRAVRRQRGGVDAAGRYESSVALRLAARLGSVRPLNNRSRPAGQRGYRLR
jgi:hypothetical protein